MDIRTVFASFLLSVAVASLAFSSGAVANEHEPYTKVDVIEKLVPRDDVIILEAPQNAQGVGSAMADAFERIIRTEPLGSGVRVLVDADNSKNRLMTATPGDVIVGADPDCEVFPQNCGLMGRLDAAPREVPCDDADNCVELRFSHVGLGDVIKRGVLRIRSEVPIRSDDECFDDRLSIISAETGSLESASVELGCSIPEQGPLPREPSLEPSIAMAPIPTMLQVANTQWASEVCRERGDWSRELHMRDGTLKLLNGAVEFDLEYRALLILSQTLRFEPSGVDGDVSMALCQFGKAGLKLVDALHEALIPLWVKGSGPHYVQLGWLPLVYSTTARLDLGLSSEAKIEISPFVTFNSAERYHVVFADSVSQDGGSKMSRLKVTPGALANINTEIQVTTRLLPVIQVNLYGVAGPFAGAELKLSGISHLAGTGRIKVGAELSSTLSAGIEARVTDKHWSHSWPLSNCGFGDLPDQSVPPCRDDVATNGPQQAFNSLSAP